MQDIGNAIEINDFLYKLAVGQAFEIISVLKPSENQFSLTYDAFSRREEDPFLADIHSADITGLVLTKLDGTAKGGAVFSIKEILDIPVKFIGVGEQVDDLQPFDPDMFVEALVEE